MRACYPSRVDWWLAVVSLAGPGAAVGALAAVARTGRTNDLLVTLVLTVVTVGFILWILLSTTYRFDGPDLVVRSGPFRWRIPVADIVCVARTRSAWSSPALSLDRIRIEYGSPRRKLLISPRHRAEFLASLWSRIPEGHRGTVRWLVDGTEEGPGHAG